jgi:phospholipid transport system substrate-binding protein
MKKYLSTALLMLFVFGAVSGIPTAAKATDAGQATQFLTALSADALKALGAPGATLEQKETAVRLILAKHFDLDLIGRFVLGAAWRKASDDQRTQYQNLFREFVLRTYSRRLGGYSGQTFQVVGSRPIGKGDILVNTKINRPSGPPIEAGWRVRNGKDGHKILDVVVAGVSMVVTQRSEFRSVIRREGIDGLIEVLRLQVTKFSARRG